MKYIIILLIITRIIYPYNSKEINNFYNEYYSSSYNIKLIENNSSRTYKNIYALITSKSMTNEKDKYNYLKETINDNADYTKSEDIDYLISVSELMNYIIYYSGLSEKISFGSKSKEIYKKILHKDKSNFFAILGTAIGYMHAPAIAGGSNEKAFEYFNKALDNSKEKYQKYLSYVWLSQYFFKIKDIQNYKYFIEMSKKIYPNGKLLEEAININNTKNKPL
ncbi:hypothetical protein OFR22_09870 [Brachyspira hyodysenteriae]|uniref:hypothetical protein n=1 Tax=Brachyspira hyodysenteriae TaxID=159 RepID=UPI0022CD31F0|nr:hypothetical protein [Brachyspira hyodysenteriae]MCZ9839615.1 hypothetical protein [Brachyspira hyodysenteriae]MCZ9847257.1 hypothetical protein [Brachyspira hyodysenteriae]MCZ9869623.1 hypothetical protein [Brachyspira hyodysenteriae]MCZ9872961.1 hypothetical protein [Brachyspira hyodysenteriae]MCZ9874851.1 hypothetical protein [Brachyspira hyodysenteriae]